ncbi:hypothetical protein [Amycolatopsis sp. CA-230715]|uniref:hypothetical protein n=1 Tax=Amycolatopsis sp. CA-230715 TaxID=2745196 RepID=UPI001C017B2B|nr:hypothetical protein [Amycolatopsis sp. CA-230715]QWF80358.1 hypothetical protein HUW46_03778 [Amycolatopsis sp. CA-230715]
MSDDDRALAWALHVELASRVTAVELRPGEGLLSEALDSLHSVFATARTALAGHVPPVGVGPESVQGLVIRMLNGGIRPFLTRWHPRLAHYRGLRAPGVSELEHEQAWEHDDQFRAELAELQVLLRDIARRFAELAGADSLLLPMGGVR